MDFKEKRKSEVSLKNFFIRSGAFLILVIFIILIIADIKIYKKRKELESDVLRYEQQIQLLKQKNTDLQKDISNSDNSDYIEKVAREEQNMQKPGEKVVSFIMPEETKQAEASKNVWDIKNWFGWLSGSWNWIKGFF